MNFINGSLKTEINSIPDIDFNPNLSEEDKEIIYKEIESINYLNSLQEPDKILNSAKACDALELILNNSTQISSFDLIDPRSQDRHVEIIISFIQKQYDNIKDLVRKYEFNFKPRRLCDLDLLLSYVKNFFRILCFTSKKSTKFCVKFQEKKGLSILFAYLTNEIFMSKLEQYSQRDINNGFENLKHMMECLLSTLHNLSIASYGFKNEWKSITSVEKFLKLAQTIGSISDFSLIIYISIANVFNDELNEISNDYQIKLVIKEIVDLIGVCATSISEGNCQRKKFKKDEDDTNPQEVAFIVSNDNEWSILEFLNSLYHLSLNERIKYEMYETHLMKEYLRMIIYSGNEREIEESLRVLWQLCFDERIANDVYNDEKLCSYIRSIHKSENIKSKSFKNTAISILWFINIKNKKNKYETKKEKDLKIENRQVFLSYNHHHQELCKKIKTEIEKEKINVWFDEDNIHGSCLDTCGKVIENSDCIIICMSEKYKQSVYCRAEAEYAFVLKKPIVPLIMEAGYKADGWLGMILGSKIYVDFTKYEFEECGKRLLRELYAVYNQVYAPEPNPVLKIENINNTPQTLNSNKINHVINWTVEDVEKWIREKKFHIAIVDQIRQIDGKSLQAIYKMLQ